MAEKRITRIRRRRLADSRSWRHRLRRWNRHHRRATQGLALLAVCGLVVLGLLAWFHSLGSRFGPTPTARDLGGLSLLEPDSSLTGRAVYPYSEIPGGVESPEELRQAIARDPVVASHYSDFNLRAARIIRLRSARAVYVSYRLDDEIFWTRRTIRLPPGEELITDGVHSARTRCGNQISAFRMEKTSPLQPSLSELESPPEVPEEMLPLYSEAVPLIGVEQPGLTLAASSPSAAPFGGIPPYAIPPGGIVIPTACPPSTTQKTASRLPSAPSQLAGCVPPPCIPSKTRSCGTPAITPEPSTWLLFLSGAAYLACRKRIRKGVPTPADAE